MSVRRFAPLHVFVSMMLLSATPARADGGAHIIDSATPETPGICHLESWVTRYDHRSGLLNLSPACTATDLPMLEMGGTMQQAWGTANDVLIGPAFKLNLRPTDSGLGLGLVAAGEAGLKSGRLETLALTVPLSVPLGDDVTANVNAGWDYVHARPDRSKAFYGAQINAHIAPDITAMIEMFGRNGEKPGGQLGLRFNPGGGRYDIDLLAGQRIDGISACAITLGFTIRR
jgi:hypothetical protein